MAPTLQDRKKFLSLVQKRTAETSVGSSTARNMGPKGRPIIKPVRKFFAGIKLQKFTKRGAFALELNRHSDRLVHKTKNSVRWGSARKFLNIFLRNATYNCFLREAYRLDKIEHLLEVPLDKHVTTWLKDQDLGKKSDLPRWKTTPEDHKAYQEFAADLAKQLKGHRVHIDLLAWRASQKKDKHPEAT